MRKKILCMILALIILFNHFEISVKAGQGEQECHIFVDGVEYTISVDNEFNIIVSGEVDSVEARMVLDSQLEGDVEIENGINQADYSVEINELEYVEIGNSFLSLVTMLDYIKQGR